MADKLMRDEGADEMKKLQNKFFKDLLAGFMMIVLSSDIGAEETIIQQEKISFEKCLKVITTSQDKLSSLRKLTMSQIKSASPSLLLSTARSQLHATG